VVVQLLWLQFGGNPFSSNYRVKSHLVRYLCQVNVPLVVLVAWALHSAFRGLVLRRLALAVVVASSAFFINFNVLGHERYTVAKQAVRHAQQHGLFPLYMDHTSVAIARFLLYGDPARERVAGFQQHSFQKGKTELVSLDDTPGYLGLVRGSVEYLENRYFMQALQSEQLRQRYPLVYQVDNPMNGAAYAQARLLVFLVHLIPVEFLSNKIAATGEGLLRDEDLLVFQIGAPAAGAGR